MPKHIRQASDTQQSRESKYRNWQEYERRQGKLDPFKDLLQRDPRVCDNCFVLRYEEVSLEWWRGDPELGWMPFEQFVPIAPDERHQEFAPQKTTAGMRLACGKCGHRTTKDRPLCKEDVWMVANHITQTLSEKDIDHDERLLLHTVERRNTSANQGRQDSHVFAPSVVAAIEAEHQNVQQVVRQHLR